MLEKPKIRDLVAVFAVAMLIVAAVTARGATSAALPSTSQAYCPGNPVVAKVGQVPLYVRLDVNNAKGQLMLGGFPLRRYRDAKHYTTVGMAVSGCWVILLFSKQHLPQQLCLTYYAPFWTPTGQECQTAKTYPSGGKEMIFHLYYK